VRISAKTDYAVRAAAELATAEPGTWMKAEAVAKAQDVPLPFLLNILSELREAGMVLSRRGAVGGYQLARPAEQIAVADVIRAVDGPLANIAGVVPEDVEYRGAATALRETWVALRVRIRSVLEEVRLSDLVAGRLPEKVAELTRDEDAWRVRG
jgi:Rrf2 family protein